LLPVFLINFPCVCTPVFCPVETSFLFKETSQQVCSGCCARKSGPIFPVGPAVPPPDFLVDFPGQVCVLSCSENAQPGVRGIVPCRTPSQWWSPVARRGTASPRYSLFPILSLPGDGKLADPQIHLTPVGSSLPLSRAS